MNITTILEILGQYTDEELTKLATALGIALPKKGSIKNALGKAILDGKARLSFTFAIKAPYPDPANPDTGMPPLAMGKLYTYKDAKVGLNPSLV